MDGWKTIKLRYEEYCKNLKVPKQAIGEEKNEKIEYDNSILNFLGLTPKDLKIKKGY